MKAMIAILAAFAISMSACTDEQSSASTLKAYGFDPVEVGGYSFFGCGDDYLYHTKFKARNPKGERVEGIMCCGVFKGCSIKF